MTIRLNQVVFADPGSDNGYLPLSASDLRCLPVSPEDTLALVRHVLRDRSDCDQIPVVNEVYKISDPNQFGDNIFIDVTYHTKGYRATYGALLTDSGISHFNCYMD